MVTPQESPAEQMPEKDMADAQNDPPPADEPTSPDATGGAIKIPFDQNPELADMFKDCQPGEMLKVQSKDDSGIVLSKEDYGDEGGEQATAGAAQDPDATAAGDENPAIAAVIAGKMKR